MHFWRATDPQKLCLLLIWSCTKFHVLSLNAGFFFHISSPLNVSYAWVDSERDARGLDDFPRKPLMLKVSIGIRIRKPLKKLGPWEIISFPVSHVTNNQIPFGIQLFIPWETGKPVKRFTL